MRILRVIHSLDPKRGGPREGARQIDGQFKKLDIHVDVLCLDSALEFNADEYPATIILLGPALGNYGFSRKLRSWLDSNIENYDAVIVNGVWQFHGLAVRKAAIRHKIPYFVFTHGMLDPWFKTTYPLKHLKKLIYWKLFENRVLRDANAVLFTSQEELDRASLPFRPYRCNALVTAYGTARPPGNASELRSMFFSRYPELVEKKIWLFLSRIHEKKGCDILIDAFARHACIDPDIRLVIAGPDNTNLKARLLDQASDLGVKEKVVWPGMLKGADKWSAYYAAELFCLPSHQENFGIVIAEALGCGVPVITTNKVNIWREILEDGAGIVSNDSTQEFSLALERWQGMSTEEKQVMRGNALASFSSRFDICTVALQLSDLIKSQLRISSKKS